MPIMTPCGICEPGGYAPGAGGCTGALGVLVLRGVALDVRMGRLPHLTPAISTSAAFISSSSPKRTKP